jgi:hypothetical protein
MEAGRADRRFDTRDRSYMATLAQILELQSVLLVESTLPGDMTIAEWRRRRPQRATGRCFRLAKLASEQLAAPDRNLRNRGSDQG